MRLCFGTFANVLKLCKQENVTDRQLVSSMTTTIDSNCKYIESDSATAVSRLFSCTGNFPSGKIKPGSGAYEKIGDNLSNVVQLALKVNTQDLVGKFESAVIPLIDEDKKTLAVLALKNIIERDNLLNSDKKRSFEKYIGQSKEAVLLQTEFDLAEFFAGLFLYTVVSVKNTIGKQFVEEIDEDFILNFKENSWLISFIDKTRENNKEIVLENDSLLKDYISKAKEKYSNIKTLLYSEQPKDFYDFYVCNNIQRRIPVHNRFGTSHKLETIKEASVKKISESSKFIILTGTGGLGKSMMMRHLLLDSFNEYKNTLEIPIFIPLKDFNDSVTDLFEYVYTKLANIDENISKEFFEKILTEGNVNAKLEWTVTAKQD